MVFWHQINSGVDIITQDWLKTLWISVYVFVFACVGYWRFARPWMYYARFGFRVVRVVPDAPDIYSVYITGRALERLHYQPGQYAHWRFLSRELWMESHPFSIISVPGNSELRLTFKNSGDFTELLKKVQPGTHVLVDGPRGSFTTNRATTDRILLIAGGIGITPFLPITTALIHANKTVELLYSAQNRSDFVFGYEFGALKATAGPEQLMVYGHVSSEKGMLTEASLLRYISPEIANQLTVYICGPEAMSKALKPMLVELGVPTHQVITERFAF